MKLFLKYLPALFILFVISAVFISCQDDEEDRNPVVHYIRVTNPASSDSLLNAAYLGDLIAVVGDNLGSLREVWFDDQRANINPTLVTDHSVILNVPATAPTVVTNKLVMKFATGKVIEHDFKMAVPAPVVEAMECEWVQPGETAVINGNYFFEPLTITFNNGVQVTPATVEATRITFEVPAGAEPGPVTVTTNFGATQSSFHFMDQRNIFLNYDNLTASGSWRPGTVGSDDPVDGNYLILKGSLKKNERAEDFPGGGYVSQFWAQANGRPQGNLVPAEGFVSDYVFKFEARVKAMYGTTLNICFAPWNNAANGEYWGNLNAKGLWEPWKANDANFVTEDWITVSIPLSEFKYAQTMEGSDITYTSMDFNREITGSLSFWVIGSPKASEDGSPVEIHIDNVRIVNK